MSRIMRDSVNAYDIPVGTPIVAGYVDGIYAWNAAAWNHHPNALHFGISVYASGYDAHCADVETGDFTPENVVDWALWRRSKGAIPYVYMNLSTWPRVINAFNARGVALPLFWVADWDGIAQIFGGSIGKQYANPTLTGGHYDESVMADYLPGLDPAPPTPAPPPVVTPPPPTSTPPADSPPPFQTSPPPVASDIDTTRTAWSNLASFLTQDLPAFVQEILRLLGLYRRTP